MAVGSLSRALAAGLLVCGLAAPARAQVADAPVQAEESAAAAAVPVDSTIGSGSAALKMPSTGWSAPALQLSLTTAFASLQALDTATTLHSVRGGTGTEANPIMGGLAQHAAAFIGIKAGLTAATIMSMRGLSKNHPKAAALTLIVLNAGSAFVVGSNFRIAVQR